MATLFPNKENLDYILRELEEYSQFSGLVINPEKCAVMKLGPF